jgi:hypothetical protein
MRRKKRVEACLSWQLVMSCLTCDMWRRCVCRFCTKNLRSLRLKAEEVKVHQEVLGMAKQ